MRRKRLWVAAGALFAVLAAAAIAIHWLVPHYVAPVLAAAVKEETGRELDLGDVAVALWPRPTLVLTQLRLANASWGSQPWLAQVGRASAELDPLALLSGRLRIRQITVADTTLFLETDAQGAGNWVMSSLEAGAGAPALPEAIVIDEITLRAFGLTYRDGKTSKATTVQLESARIAAVPTAGSIELGVQVRFEGKSVEAAGRIGTLRAVLANTPFPVDLEVKLGTASASLRGGIDKPLDLAGFGLALQAQVPELSDLAALFGASMPPFGPLRAAVQLSGTAAAPVFGGIDVAIGTPGLMDLTLRGEVAGIRSSDGGYEWQSDGVELRAEGTQLGDLSPWVTTSLPALGPFRVAARLAGTTAVPALPVIDVALGGSRMPAVTLRGSVADLRTMSGIDVKLAAAATAWWRLEAAADAPRLPPFRAAAHVRGTSQDVNVDDLELKVADSTVRATLQVKRGGPRPRVTGKLSSPLIDLARRAPTTDTIPKATAPAPAARKQPAAPWKFADVDLELQIARLIFPGRRELRSGSGRVSVEDGRLNVSALRATLGGARVKVEGSIADPPNLAGIDASVALQGGDLAELFRFFGKPSPPVGPYQGQARLQGSLDALQLTAIEASAGHPGQRLRASGRIDDLLRGQGIALAIAADVGDIAAAGRLFGAELPRLPVLRATARLSSPQGGYLVDELELTLGRTSAKGRVMFAPGEPRPRLTVDLGGPMLDVAELVPARPSKKPAGAAPAHPSPAPAPALDAEANIRFDRVVLPGRRALGPVSGMARLDAGALELKQVSVALDGASATVEGTIGDPAKMTALALVLNAEVKHSAGLAALTGLNLGGLPPISASATLNDVPDGYAIAGLKIAHAAATISGDVVLTRSGQRPKLSAKLSAPSFDVSAILPPAAAASAAQATAAEPAAAQPAAPGTRAIAQVDLPLDALRTVDADLDLRIDTLKFAGAEPLGPLLLRAVLADGHLKAEPLQLAGQPGQMLTVSASVDAAQAQWDLRVEAKEFELGVTLARFGSPGVLTGGPTELVLQLRGRGKTLQALLGSLDGDARVQVGPLRLNNVAIDFDRGIFTRVLGAVNPARKSDPDTEVKCIAARVPIRNGVLSSDQGIAAETPNYNVLLNGSLDLRTEAIDIAVTPVVTSGLGVGTTSIAQIVRVGGTLSNPALGVDPVGVAKSAVSAGVAVVATPWWLAEAALMKSRTDPHPCATALGK